MIATSYEAPVVAMSESYPSLAGEATWCGAATLTPIL